MPVQIGKILLVVGLCLQAYLLLLDKSTIASFQNDLASTLKRHQFIPNDIATFLTAYLHIIIASLLFTSILLLISKSNLSKILIIIGLCGLLFSKYGLIFKIPSFKERTFWQIIAVIGGVLYLMGIERVDRK